MKKAVIFCLLYLSGCLMTHRDIKKSDQEKELHERKHFNTQKTPPSFAEKLEQTNESLRELRGEVERIEKDQNEKISALKKDLLPLVQSLDLQLAVLQSKVEKQTENTKTPIYKNTPQENFFLTAEKFFKEKKWKVAIINYEKYRENNKKGSFYKQATFRIGLSFIQLNMRKEGAVFLREIISSYPKSQEAVEAKKLLKKP